MSVIASAAVWTKSKAQGNTRLVALALADCAKDNGWCWPGIDYIAKKCLISRRAVSERLRELERLGELMIEMNAGPNFCNRYLLLLVSAGSITAAPHEDMSIPMKPASSPHAESACPEIIEKTASPMKPASPPHADYGKLHDADTRRESAYQPSGTVSNTPPPRAREAEGELGEDLEEFPGEPEVLAFGRAYGGSLAKGIPAGIPDGWLQSYWGWRTFQEQFWPKNWRQELVWKFEMDWVQGHPKARGALAAVKKNGNGVWAVKQRLEQLKMRCAAHPANEASAAYCGDPSPALMAELENLQQEIRKCGRQLEGAT